MDWILANWEWIMLGFYTLEKIVKLSPSKKDEKLKGLKKESKKVSNLLKDKKKSQKAINKSLNSKKKALKDIKKKKYKKQKVSKKEASDFLKNFSKEK